MKNFLVIIMAVIMTLPAIAQKKQPGEYNYPLSVGPYLGIRGGVNTTDPPEGIKNAFSISSLPDFGVTGYLPLSDEQKMGAVLDLGYHTISYGQKFDADEDMNWVLNLNYFNIGPAFSFNGFLIGLNVGVPLGGTNSSDDEEIQQFLLGGEEEIDIEADHMATIVELRLGGMIPLVKTETGRLNFIIDAGYFLTGVADSKELGDDENNYHPVTLRLGLNYLFNLPE